MNRFALAALLVAVTTLPAVAATVVVGSSDGTIGTLDTASGAISGAYDAGPALFDIAIDNSGNVFGTSGSTLYSIDVVSNAVGVALGSHSFVNALAFDNNDVLYGSGYGNLYALDTVTGASTLVGAIGSGYDSSGDIAYAGGMTFLGTSSSGCQGSGDCLFSIDSSTGVGTYIGDIGFDDVYGVALISGTLYGMTAADQLIEIDKASGAGTLLDTYSLSGSTYGAAAPASAAVVPLPAAVWLLLSGLGMLGVARRRAAQV